MWDFFFVLKWYAKFSYLVEVARDLKKVGNSCPNVDVFSSSSLL